MSTNGSFLVVGSLAAAVALCVTAYFASGCEERAPAAAGAPPEPRATLSPDSEAVPRGPAAARRPEPVPVAAEEVRDSPRIQSDATLVGDVSGWLAKHGIPLLEERPSEAAIRAVHESVQQTVDGLRVRMRDAEDRGDVAALEQFKLSELKQAATLESLYEGSFVMVPAGSGEKAMRGLSDAIRGCLFVVFAASTSEDGTPAHVLVTVRPRAALSEARYRARESRRHRSAAFNTSSSK